MKSLWLDDIREPPDGNWVWVTNVEDAKQHFLRYAYESISLDHDLGENEPTGYDFLCFVEELQNYWYFPLPTLTVHSMNPVGRKNMLRAIDAIVRRHYGG